MSQITQIKIKNTTNKDEKDKNTTNKDEKVTLGSMAARRTQPSNFISLMCSEFNGSQKGATLEFYFNNVFWVHL